MENEIILTKSFYYKKTSKEFEELDNLCFKSKNLYNATLYRIRQYYFEHNKYLNYKSINKEFTNENQFDYRQLPAKVSKHVQMLVDKNFKSFFALLKLKEKGKYDKPIKIPKYLHKVKGRQVLNYEKGALSFKKAGYIKLSKTNILIPLCEIKKEKVQFVRIIPLNNEYKIELGYKKETKPIIFNENTASIDLGINNLVTLVSNKDSLIIDGRKIKSINRLYNKKLAEYTSELIIKNNKYSSKKIIALTNKRNKRVDYYLHKTSRMLVNHLVLNNISKLIIGYNKNLKQDINKGHVNNQNIVQVPLLKLVQMLEYKCRLEGILVIQHEESYTSQASFLDNDFIPTYGEEKDKEYEFSGYRMKRGLYKSKKLKKCINADLNGALNIMKKYYINTLKEKVKWEELYSELIAVSSKPLHKLRVS